MHRGNNSYSCLRKHSLPGRKVNEDADGWSVSDEEVLKKVLEVFEEETLISAMCGFEEVKLSSRFLARRARVSLELANRAVNLFCCLGILEKVPDEKSNLKGNRFTLLTVDHSEIERRWEALGRPSLRQFNRSLVVERLGEEVTVGVHLRRVHYQLVSQEE